MSRMVTVTVPVRFTVISLREYAPTEAQAKEAVAQAVFDHLAIDAVTVHVDGFGECRVQLDEEGDR